MPIIEIISIKHIPTSIRLLTWIYENTILLHLQVFRKMNTWLFETCRRQYRVFQKEWPEFK